MARGEGRRWWGKGLNPCQIPLSPTGGLFYSSFSPRSVNLTTVIISILSLQGYLNLSALFFHCILAVQQSDSQFPLQ